jgi:hypothetical protein
VITIKVPEDVRFAIRRVVIAVLQTIIIGLGGGVAKERQVKSPKPV